MPPEPPDALTRYWQASRARIDERLAQLLEGPADAPEALTEALRYGALAPGKRIRGVVLVATAELLGGPEEPAIDLACAVELVHAASLVLDDLPCMDDASLRRGRPVLHRVVGEANAILAAVGLLNAAFAQVQRATDLNPRVRGEITLCLADAVGVAGLIGGQALDLAVTGRTIDLEALEQIHRQKTGALFAAACEIGGLVGRAGPRRLEALRRYARNVGLAFQITDDLLDHTGTPETTGKDAGLDRDRTTFAALCGVEGAHRLVDELIDAAQRALAPLGDATVLLGLAEFVRRRDR